MDNKIPHILIVDDDVNLLGTLRDILKMKGFEPVIAPTGAAALVQLERHHFDLALVDLRLDDMSGLLVLRAIKTHSPETECILLTGHASQDTAIEAVQMGVYGYFQKPFDMEQVLLSIQRALEKKQSAQALHNSEQRFRALIENGRDNISLLAADGTLLWESPSTKSTLAYAPDQFVGRNIFELLHPDDRGLIQELFAQLVQSPGKSQDGIFRLQHGDGTWRWIESTTTNMLNEPSVQAIVINYRDISERKQAEEKIAQTEKRFRSLIENAPDGVVLVGLDGKYKYASPAALRIFNYKPEDVIDANPNEQTHPDDLSMVLGVLQDLIANPSNVSTIQYRFMHKDGSWRWIESVFTNLLAEPNVEAIVINFRDITERKHAEEALHKSETLFTSLFHANPTRISITRLEDSCFLAVNETFLKSIGYTREEVVGRTSSELNDWVDQQDRIRLRGLLEDQGKVKDFETQLRRKSGEIMDVLISAELIELFGETCILSVGLDITERKQAENKLRESEKRYRSIFDGVQDAIFIESKDGRILEVNNSACEIYGYKRDEFVTKTVRDLVPEEINILYPPQAQPNISPLPLETINRRANGDLFPIEISGGLQILNGKEIFLVIVRDITERKRVEEALYESEERFRNAFQYSAIGMALVSLEGKWLKVNPTICSIVGYSEGELTAITFQDITHPDDLDSDLNYLDQLLGGKIVSYTMEKRYFHKEGNIVWALLTVALAKDNAGMPLYLISQIEDISERKRAEGALRESESLYRQAIEVSGAVPYLQSYTGEGTGLHYDFIGEGIYQITGYEAGEFNAALWDKLNEESILLGDLASYSMEEAIQRVRSGEIPLWKCEHRIRARDGKIHWVFEAAVELYTENRVAKGSIGMFQDITERKQAEDLLRKSEKRYHDLFENSPIALREEDFSAVKQRLNTLRQEGVTDFHTYLAIHSEVVVECAKMVKIREVNKAALKLYGADSKYSMPNDFAEILGKAYEHFRGQLADIAEGQTEFTWEGIDHKIDGSQIDVEVNWSIAEGYENDLSKVIVSLQDISTRKQADQAIHQRVAELGLLYESGLVFSQLLNPKEIGKKIIDLLGEKLDWHHTAIRLVRPQDNSLELIAFDQPGLKDKTEAHAVETQLNSFITRVGEGLSGWALQQSKTIRLGDVTSDPHYVATYPGLHSGLYVPLKSGDHVLGVISIESELPNAFSEGDEQLLATLANQAANAFENARLYQTARQEIIERKRVENLLAEERNQLAQRVEERTADLSRVNADLANAVRVKDEFLASMSHELRTPLTGILGLSEVLQLKIYGEINDKQRSTLKTIEESGRHLLDLINDILDLSKIEAGKLDLQFAPYSLGDICQASLQLIKGMAQHKRQHVNYTPPTEPIIIRADARRLKQLLVNLLSNAIKFTPENGELGLEVEAIQSERKIKLTVWDKGIGIKPEDMNRLFKPFTQLDGGLAREYSGTGLGLSLVRHLTELHNGGIEVQSNFGQGSRFTVILQWSPQNTTPIPYAMLRHGNTGGLNSSALPNHAKPLVMYVDDNEMVLQMVGDFLEANQYRVIKVRNGLELLERAAEQHPHIMLVDIQMPGIGGMETIRRIRAHPDPVVAAAPVIAVTALAMPTDRERCLLAGANDYMSKPLKLKELAAAIQRLLERKQ